jgi:2',3'-cyclic-nucleotide 2'-phosphodiesterase (5'-nucleotidase family)
MKHFSTLACTVLLTSVLPAKQVFGKISIPFLSANLLDSVTEEPIFKPYTLINRGGIRFGVIGLTDLVPDTIEQLIVDDYTIAGNIYLSAMEGRVDMTVLLINSDSSTYGDLHEIFPSADLIFTSGSTFMTRPMMDQKENGPFVFSSGREGRYLNQVDVSIVDDGDQIINRSYHEAKINYFKKRIDRYRDKDPDVPLNELYSEQPSILSSISESQDEIKRMEEILTRKTNSITFQNVAMESKIKDDPEMLEHVNRSIKKCKDLIDNH